MTNAKLSADERLLRRRQAARVRQQRCRARKRQALVEAPEVEKPNLRSKVPFAMESRDEQFQSHVVHPRSDESPRSVGRGDGWAPYMEYSRTTHPPSFDRSHSASFAFEPRLCKQERVFDGGIKYHPVNRFPCFPSPRSTSLPPYMPHQRPSSYYRYGECVRRERDVEYYRYKFTKPNYQAPKSWVHPIAPRSSSSHLVEEVKDPMMSKEETAIDAILSLKSGKVTKDVVSPPSLKQLFSYDQIENSAFRRLSKRTHPPLGSAVYMAVRIA